VVSENLIAADPTPENLMTDRLGRPVTGKWITQNARHHFDGLGMPGVRMHRLRHRFGTLIQSSIGDLRVTQECLRHRSVTSTQGYTLVTGRQRTAAVASLPVPKSGPASL